MNGPMKTVKVSEANQQFSKLIREVEHDGVTIRILRRDRPIAVLKPEGDDDRSAQVCAAALEGMKRLHRKGMRLGTEPFDRDALHDRA